MQPTNMTELEQSKWESIETDVLVGYHSDARQISLILAKPGWQKRDLRSDFMAELRLTRTEAEDLLSRLKAAIFAAEHDGNRIEPIQFAAKDYHTRNLIEEAVNADCHLHRRFRLFHQKDKEIEMGMTLEKS